MRKQPARADTLEYQRAPQPRGFQPLIHAKVHEASTQVWRMGALWLTRLRDPSLSGNCLDGFLDGSMGVWVCPSLIDSSVGVLDQGA